MVCLHPGLTKTMQGLVNYALVNYDPGLLTVPGTPLPSPYNYTDNIPPQLVRGALATRT